MDIKTIDLGNYANDGTGDDLRTAFTKVNENFALLNNEVTIANATNVGGGIKLFSKRNGANLEFKTLISRDNSVILTTTSDNVNLQAVTKLENDITPKLNGDLHLNGFTIKNVNGGGVESLVYDIDIRTLNSLVSMLISSEQTVVDFGTFLIPTGYDYFLRPRGYTVDLGTFIVPLEQHNLDFGSF